MSLHAFFYSKVVRDDCKHVVILHCQFCCGARVRRVLAQSSVHSDQSDTSQTREGRSGEGLRLSKPPQA